MKSNLRVIILSPFFPPDKGGVESFLQAVCSELDLRKVDYRVITFNPLKESKKDVEPTERNIVRIPWMGKGVFDRINHRPGLVFCYIGIPYLLLGTVLAVKFSFARQNVVLLGNGLIGSLAAVFTKRFARSVKVVSTFHAVYEQLSYPVEKILGFVLGHSDKVLGCSSSVRSQIVSLRPAVNTKTTMFYYWIDRSILNLGSQLSPRPSLDTPKIGFIGRLIPEKGVLTMDEISRTCQVSVVVYGTGPMELECERLAAENEKFVFKGKLQRKDLVRALQDLDFLVIPSFYAEAGPIVLIECLAFGVVPVVTSCSGYASVLEGSKLESFIVHPSEAAVVACVQRSLRASKPELERWKKECSVIYARYFTPDVAIPRFFEKIGI